MCASCQFALSPMSRINIDQRAGNPEEGDISPALFRAQKLLGSALRQFSPVG
ncbi:hypothetical protein WN51_01697 [Melipona quadrifasciata]|uniref:Uncharacterized protein n=1 Tax=Melipona quadrifasciata TaxID=166423 RepID=A0A0M8ZX64_9HYME|nr:hypothetical protein WN51_01697 [Melipona quadrifasciata]